MFSARSQRRSAISVTSFSLAWTAVCRPPSLKPLALWPHGNTWDGGGFFQDNRTLTIIWTDGNQAVIGR